MDEPTYATWTITKKVFLEPLPELTPEQEALFQKVHEAMLERLTRRLEPATQPAVTFEWREGRRPFPSYGGVFRDWRGLYTSNFS